MPLTPSLDGNARQSGSVRVGLTAAYTMFALAGLALLVSPNALDTYGRTSTIFAGFMLLGGAGAAGGVGTKRWVGEFTGLPLLISAFVAFGTSVYGTLVDFAPYGALSASLFLWGVAAFAFARWRVAIASFRLVRSLAQHEHAREDEGDE